MKLIYMLSLLTLVVATPIPADLELKAAEPRSLSMKPVDGIAARDSKIHGGSRVIDHISFNSAERRSELLEN